MDRLTEALTEAPFYRFGWVTNSHSGCANLLLPSANEFAER